MRVLINTLSWAFLVTSAIIVQSSHILDFWDVNPNLILIFFFLPLILEREFSRTLILILITLILIFIFLPYWPKEILILTGLALVGLFLRKFLTGRELWDFLILIFLGTLGFYLINSFSYVVNNPVVIIVEIFFNIILGTLLVFLIANFSKIKINDIERH